MSAMEEAVGALEIEFRRVTNNLEFVSHRIEADTRANSSSSSSSIPDALAITRRLHSLTSKIEALQTKAKAIACKREALDSGVRQQLIDNQETLRRIAFVANWDPDSAQAEEEGRGVVEEENVKNANAQGERERGERQKGKTSSSNTITNTNTNMSSSACSTSGTVFSSIRPFSGLDSGTSGSAAAATVTAAADILPVPKRERAATTTATAASASDAEDTQRQREREREREALSQPAPTPAKGSQLTRRVGGTGKTAKDRDAYDAAAIEKIVFTEETFLSVPSSTRGRSKYTDVVKIYENMVDECVALRKGSATLKELDRAGIKVAGKTGDSVLAVLRVMNLITVSRQEVTLVRRRIVGPSGRSLGSIR